MKSRKLGFAQKTVKDMPHLVEELYDVPMLH